MSNFLRASNPQADLQAMALAAFGAGGAGIILPVWFDQDAWLYPLSGLVLYETPVSGLPASSGVGGSSAIGFFAIGESPIGGEVNYLGSVNGFCAAMSDGASGVYLCQHLGSLIRYSSAGALTAYSLQTGLPYVGGTYLSSQSAPYVLQGGGSLYTLSGTGSGAVMTSLMQNPAFGSPAYSLHGSGSTLFTILASASGIGTFNLSSQTSGVSGFIPSPLQSTLCIAVASGTYPLTAGGWNQNLFPYGFSAFSPNLNPENLDLVLGVSSGAGSLSLLTQVSGGFTLNQTLSGLSYPSFVTWAPNGTSALVCDPVSGHVYDISYLLGSLAVAQTVAVSGAAQVALTPAADYAVVTQPAYNQISILHNTGTWAVAATLPLSGATAIISVSASGVAIGYRSGIAYANLIGSGWSIGSSGVLPFLPNWITEDSYGNLYAVGTVTGSGYLAEINGTAVSASGYWSGSGDQVLWEQGQITIADIASSLIRIFEPEYSFGSNTLSLSQANAYTVASGLTALSFSSPYLLASVSGSTLLYQYGAPYSLFPEQSGVVSIYNAASGWASVGLGPLNTPETVVFDPSGNISAITLQNNFFTVSPSGAAVIASALIPQGINQPQTTPIGFSKLLWLNGHLYGSTSLNDSLVEVI